MTTNKAQAVTALALPAGTMPTINSLALPSDLSFGGYVDVFRFLSEIDSASQWWWGDAINAADNKHGEMYTEAENVSGKPLATLQAYAYVSRAFQTLHRCKLSWTHHKAAAGAGDARHDILKQAEENKWSVARLRQEVAAIKNPPEKVEVLDISDWQEADEEPIDAEVIPATDNQEPENDNTEIEWPRNGVRKAHKAIQILSSIAFKDELRTEGFDLVIDWINTNR